MIFLKHYDWRDGGSINYHGTLVVKLDPEQMVEIDSTASVHFKRAITQACRAAIPELREPILLFLETADEAVPVDNDMVCLLVDRCCLFKL